LVPRLGLHRRRWLLILCCRRRRLYRLCLNRLMCSSDWLMHLRSIVYRRSLGVEGRRLSHAVCYCMRWRCIHVGMINRTATRSQRIPAWAVPHVIYCRSGVLKTDGRRIRNRSLWWVRTLGAVSRHGRNAWVMLLCNIIRLVRRRCCPLKHWHHGLLFHHTHF
jgi:hypothetical protein